jgi:hypothetical protein
VGGAGADTLDGEADVDLLSYSDVTSATAHGLADISGMAINLTGSAITAATVATNAGGTIVIGGGAGAAGAALAAGTVGYLATSAAASTATMVRDTVSNFEQVLGSTLADVIYGTAAASTIDGGAGADFILGGAGADSLNGSAGVDTIAGAVGQDTITSGDGADIIIVATGSATGLVGGAGFAGTITGFDVIADLTTGTTANLKDKVDFQVAPIAHGTDGAGDGTDSALVVGGAGTDKVISHTAATATGLASFVKTGGGALTIATDADLAAVVQYLNGFDLGDAGALILFRATYTTATRGSTAHTYLYQQTTNDNGTTGGFQLVDIVGVSLLAFETTASTTNLNIFVA